MDRSQRGAHAGLKVASVGQPPPSAILAPADLPKDGTGYDLPIAVGILTAARPTRRRSRILEDGERLAAPAYIASILHSSSMDRAAAEAWIRTYIEPFGAMETTHERPWAIVLRVPLADGVAWFKACGPVQAFEPRLTADLFARWPDLVSEVLGYDEERSWLLLADAGTPIGVSNSTPEHWLAVLPRYAELQRGETAHAHEHLQRHVPDLRLATLPERYENLLRHDLPLQSEETARLRTFATRFAELCRELAGHDVPETVQHDDLHAGTLFAQGERLRVLDWGDSSISHPFASLVVTFRFLEEINQLAPADPWFGRLRDAYLEPWGHGLAGTFKLAMRVGAFAHMIAWARQRDALPDEARAPFNIGFQTVLRRAVAQTFD